MKTVAIMQPYFLPYIGYFQLIASADLFILYDNIKYTKKGWINRNRLLQNGQDVMFSLPLKSDSDQLNVIDRELASSFNREKLLHQFQGAYQRAPFFKQTYPLIEQIVRYNDTNLFGFLYHAIRKICEYLAITTEIKISSEIAIDHNLKGQEKVLALCTAVGANTYVNAIGGKDLYSKEVFHSKGIDLKFIQSHAFVYPQFDNEFVPWLSIIDVMMFNSITKIQATIHDDFDLI